MPKGTPATPLVWKKFGEHYEVQEDGKKLVFKAQSFGNTGPKPGTVYHTALADHIMEPGTGRYYWELAANLDNFKIGVALPDADVDSEMGYSDRTWCVYIQTGDCEHRRQERLKPEGVQRRLWRLVVPICGGRFGCLLDTKHGTLQLFFNGEYQGMAFDENSGLKGKAVVPAVGLAGIEDNNRSIGHGQKYCKVIDDATVPRISSVEKKVIC
eukprot:TRINITY_DN49893_c0_g1_i1.p2 TRINITY_DN49893_c0_g1~~TRINITY_DN49893_c0_g1_i1.p2  ORF type:complete len:244 (+),score=96.10 TRINITY_DN49893_c0_g1_i1:98-733(+)